MYEVDSKWAIVRANDALCRVLRASEAGLIGRDIRDLLREDWRVDFRNYVARALVGVGDFDVTLPLVAPCGTQGWFKHTLEPLIQDGVLLGYRAIVVPHNPRPAPRRWWQRLDAARTSYHVWNFEAA